MNTNNNPTFRALCAEHFLELRGMFERILCVARSSDGFAVGNIQLADRLINAVVSWSENSLTLPEPVAPTDEALANFSGWFCRNYPGPDTIIHKPEWHAPKVFRAATNALARWGTPATLPEPVAPTDDEIFAEATKFLYFSFAHIRDPNKWDGTDADLLAFARAVLARWGTPANTINQEDYDRG
jgi:hypothetical protein